jgi:hypothetical protein
MELPPFGKQSVSERQIPVSVEFVVPEQASLLNWTELKRLKICFCRRGDSPPVTGYWTPAAQPRHHRRQRDHNKTPSLILTTLLNKRLWHA